MGHIKEGVKGLSHGISTEEKENGKSRVARALDLICRFIDEFEGLRERGKKPGDSCPKKLIQFNNSIGSNYEPKKIELEMRLTTLIKDVKKEL